MTRFPTDSERPDDADAGDAAFLEPRVRALPQQIQPPRDLWPEIRVQLPPRRRVTNSWFRAHGWQLAAGIAIAVMSSAGTAYFLRSNDGTPSFSSELATRALESQLDKLHPATLAALQHNLAVIDSAIAESRQALSQDPGNPALIELLQAVQQQRLQLLRQATSLPRS